MKSISLPGGKCLALNERAVHDDTENTEKSTKNGKAKEEKTINRLPNMPASWEGQESRGCGGEKASKKPSLPINVYHNCQANADGQIKMYEISRPRVQAGATINWKPWQKLSCKLSKLHDSKKRNQWPKKGTTSGLFTLRNAGLSKMKEKTREWSANTEKWN